MDAFRLCLAIGPVAMYLLLLGALNLSRRPLLVSARDAAALWLAVSGLIIIGPLELFIPFDALARLGPYAWVLLLSLVCHVRPALGAAAAAPVGHLQHVGRQAAAGAGRPGQRTGRRRALGGRQPRASRPGSAVVRQQLRPLAERSLSRPARTRTSPAGNGWKMGWRRRWRRRGLAQPPG